MRTASTDARTEEIQGNLIGSQCKAELALYFENSSGDWQLLEDLDEENGVNWTDAGQRSDYANVVLIPAVSTIEFQVKNFEGKWSPGSNSFFDNALDLNTRIKLKAGYQLTSLGLENTESMSMIEGPYCFNYNTTNNGSAIVLDEPNIHGNVDSYFTDFFNVPYDSTTYDATTYTPSAYFVSTFAFTKQGLNNIVDFDITTNTTNGTIFYRTFNDREAFEANNTTSASWTNAGATTGAAQSITVTSGNDAKYLQVAVIFDGVAWSDDIQVTSLDINFTSYIEWIYESVYYLDSPEYQDPPAPEIPVIICSGRDSFKKAIETDLNIEDLSGGVFIDQLIKDTCDQIGLGYTTASIADLTVFGTRNLATGLEDAKKATDVFEKCMQILTQRGSDRYVMYTRYDSSVDDKILFVQPRPETFEEFAAFQKNYVSQIGAKRRNYDRLMKRMTVLSKNGTAAAQEQLGTGTYTTASTQTISWSGDAEYKRYTVTVNSGSPTVTLDTTDPVQPTQISFIITGTEPFSVTITVFGNKWDSGAPTYEGEAIHHENMIANKGITRRIENLLIKSDTECRLIAEGFIDDYGSPSFEVGGLVYPYLYLLADLNDGALLISPIVFINTIYLINSISHHWDRSSSPSDSSSFNLNDSGSELSNAQWDSGLKWNSGLIWDIQFPLSQTSDVTNYDYLKPVEFS